MTDHVPAPAGAWFFLIYYFLNYSFFQKYSKKFLDAILSLCYYGLCGTMLICHAKKLAFIYTALLPTQNRL